LSGDFLQINVYLVAALKEIGMWTAEIREEIKLGNGSIQHIKDIPAPLRTLYRTAWELSQRSLVDMAAARGAFIDQSQSLNLFMESPTIGKVSSMPTACPGLIPQVTVGGTSSARRFTTSS